MGKDRHIEWKCQRMQPKPEILSKRQMDTNRKPEKMKIQTNKKSSSARILLKTTKFQIYPAFISGGIHCLIADINYIERPLNKLQDRKLCEVSGK